MLMYLDDFIELLEEPYLLEVRDAKDHRIFEVRSDEYGDMTKIMGRFLKKINMIKIDRSDKFIIWIDHDIGVEHDGNES